MESSMCHRCFHEWFRRTSRSPKKCPKCGSYLWKSARKLEGIDGKVSLSELPTKPFHGYVYVIEHTKTEPKVKIGSTAYPIDRIHEVRTEHGANGRVYVTELCANFFYLEQKAHKVFQDQSMYSEWFNITFEKAVTFLKGQKLEGLTDKDIDKLSVWDNGGLWETADWNTVISPIIEELGITLQDIANKFDLSAEQCRELISGANETFMSLKLKVYLKEISSSALFNDY